MPKLILLAVVAIIAGFFGYNQLLGKTYIDADKTVKGDFQVGQGKTATLRNGAKLTVEGNVSLNGEVDCQNGPIYIEVKGNLTVGGTIKCERTEAEIQSGRLGMGMVFVVSGSTTLSKNSILITNGNLQFVDKEENIAKTQEDIEKIFDEVESSSPSNNTTLGPLVPNGLTQKDQTFNLVKPVYADSHKFVSQGTIVIGSPKEKLPKDLSIATPPRGIRHIIINYNLPGADLELKDQTIIGPDGLDGLSISDECDINIPAKESEVDKKAKDALRFNAKARNIFINNFELWLGSGGQGGTAQTKVDCYPKATAIAGDGGKAGNFRFQANSGIYVQGSFNIHPGISGSGGDAIATAGGGGNGVDYQDGEKGGSAFAKGGNGADNIKDLSWLGVVKGVENISIDSVIAGAGGNAGAKAGSGGTGGCGAKGGQPGQAEAKGGKGGKYQLKIPQQVKRMAEVNDSDGPEGRPITEFGQKGKDGLPCSDKAGYIPKTTKPEGYAYQAAPVSQAGSVFLFRVWPRGYHTPTMALAKGPIYLDIHLSLQDPQTIKDYLPIRVVMFTNGNQFWEGTMKNGNVSCWANDSLDDCASIAGPTISDDWYIRGETKLTFKLYDKEGKELPQRQN
ncbi:hypothetical protein HYW46_00020 [Candidatus Daviesbacteria bacterium]|nr:hypothetical protein [Candidatus Daviesbacteria bacterium]